METLTDRAKGCFEIMKEGKFDSIKCNYCKQSFKGSGVNKLFSHLGDVTWNGQRAISCSSKNPVITALRKDIVVQFKTVQKENEKKTNAKQSPMTTVTKLFAKQSCESVDCAITEFLAATNTPPSVTDAPEFLEMLRCYRSASSQYQLPIRRSFGLDGGELGRSLQLCLDKTREMRLKQLEGIENIGGTVCSDGAKNIRRNALNTTLNSAVGSFFMQSTDCTGKIKNAEYLYADIKKAIESVGTDKVFIVCMDGACKKTLRLVEEGLPKVFGQRCSTHGCSLLCKDVGKLFLWEIKFCLKLLHFILHHDDILHLFSTFGPKQLLGVCETRYASQIYSSERIVEDKQPIQQLFVSAELVVLIQRRQKEDREKLLLVHNELKKLVLDDSTWEKLVCYLSVEIPLRQLLRFSDRNTPTLSEICYKFATAKRECIKFSETLEQKPFYPGYKLKIEQLFGKREKDICTDLAKAASKVSPYLLYPEVSKNCDVSGSKEALFKVITKYFGPDTAQIIAAKKLFIDFTEKKGWFASEEVKVMTGKSYLAEEFWSQAQYNTDDYQSCGLFRKLCNGFSGQGEAERMNKTVKNIRTAERNKQSHLVTAAYSEIKQTLHFQPNHKKVRRDITFADFFKNVWAEILDDRQPVQEPDSAEAPNDEEIEDDDDWNEYDPYLDSDINLNEVI
jgi:hypothetical protein